VIRIPGASRRVANGAVCRSTLWGALLLIAGVALGSLAGGCGSGVSQTLSKAASGASSAVARAATTASDSVTQLASAGTGNDPTTTDTTTTTTTTTETTTTTASRERTTTVTTTASAPPATTTTATVAKTTNNTTTVGVKPAETAASQSGNGIPWWAWVLIGLGAAAVAIGIFFRGNLRASGPRPRATSVLEEAPGREPVPERAHLPGPQAPDRVLRAISETLSP
jgi:hypothetical protein